MHFAMLSDLRKYSLRNLIDRFVDPNMEFKKQAKEDVIIEENDLGVALSYRKNYYEDSIVREITTLTDENKF